MLEADHLYRKAKPLQHVINKRPIMQNNCHFNREKIKLQFFY